MTRLAHISDPHFGTVDPVVERALLEELDAADVIAISGDLTQRARPEQFELACAFLARLRAPFLVVPGNHDVPAYNPIARLFRPLARYRKYITSELVPAYRGSELAMVGIATAHGLTTKHGEITDEHLHAVCVRFSRETSRWKALVSHHPLVAPPQHEDDIAEGAARALPRLEECGVEVLLSGHTHAAFADAAIQSPNRKLIAIHAGTCMSTRLRGEPNGYNWLDFAGDRLTVTHRVWSGARFIDGAVQRYERRPRAQVLARV